MTNSIAFSNDVFFDALTKDISAGERVRIRAKGSSMLPFIRNKKDEIVLKPVTDSLKKGMIILSIVDNGNYVVHRIEKIENNAIVLRGDGNLTVREVCLPENVIAKVEAVIRGNTTVKENSFQWNLYRYLWPKSTFLRRIILGIYRRMIG